MSLRVETANRAEIRDKGGVLGKSLPLGWGEVGGLGKWRRPGTGGSCVCANHPFRPQLIILECVTAFDDVGLRQVVSEWYHMVVLKICPSSLGIPSHRPRKWMLLTCKASTIWHGGSGDDAQKCRS